LPLKIIEFIWPLLVFRSCPESLHSAGELRQVPLGFRSAFRQQSPQFRFRLGAHAVDESIRALPVFSAERRQTHLQVRLVLFQSAQQPLGSRDFSSNVIMLKVGHGEPRIYTATAVAERKLQAGCRVRGVG